MREASQILAAAKAYRAMKKSNRYLVTVDNGETSEDIPICNSKAIANGVFETQCKERGVFSVRLTDLRTGKRLRYFQAS